MTLFGAILGAQEAKNQQKPVVFLTFLLFTFLAFHASSGALLGPLGALLVPSLPLLGPPERSQGSLWKPLGVPWVALGTPQARLGSLLGPSWGHCLLRRAPMAPA